MKRGLLMTVSMMVSLGCGGGGGAPPPPVTTSTDAALYAQAVQDYNGKAYTTAKGEFGELLARPSATAYHDKATVYIAAIDFYQGNPATCLSVLGSPTAPTSGFFATYPGSAEMDRARYWHGRCELGLTPPAYLTARGDFTAVITMPPGTYTDNAYLWRGRTYYATALATGDEASLDWASALSDFQAVISSFGTGTVAPEAKYWLGRTHFARGDTAKARGTQVGDQFAKAEYVLAASELGQHLTTYPGNFWAPDVSVYLARTHLEQASFAIDKVTAYGAAAGEFVPVLGTTAAVRDEANYWYGRTLYELGLAHETATVPDFPAAQAQLLLAETQLRKFQSDATLSTSKLADNASYWVGRCLFSQADLKKTRAVLAADFAGAQVAFAAAEASLAATKGSSQFATSNVLDLVQIYLGRSQFEQGVCAAAQGLVATALYSTAQLSFGDYFIHYGTPALPSAAAFRYWRGRTYYAQASLAPAITDFDTVVASWDFVGIVGPARPTTVWWDNSQYYLVRSHSDQVACPAAQVAYDALKAAIPADSLLPAACTYMKGASRCPGNTCP